MGHDYRDIIHMGGNKKDRGNVYYSGQDSPLNRLPYAVEAPFHSYSRKHDPTCLPNTRVDVLQEIYNWADGQDERCIFWLNGWAGTGKSTIARTIACRYYEQKRFGASFFFSRGCGDVSHARKFVTSIALQLANISTSLKDCICETITAHKDIANQSLSYQWHQLVLLPLSKLDKKSCLSSYILVVDALDECEGESDVRTILRLLAEARSIEPVRLRVFMTSRPDIPIQHGIYHIPKAEYQEFVLHNISPSLVDQDLSVFLEYKLTLIAQECSLGSGWPGKETIRYLVQKASGFFIWAAIACRFIQAGKRFASDRLSIILQSGSSSAVPQKHLDEIYLTVLMHALSPDYPDKEKTEFCSMLTYILGSTITFLSPLPVLSLSVLLHVTKEDIDRTLEDLHSIVDIPEDQSCALQLHHPLLRDFLVDENRCSDPNLLVDEKQAHWRLAECCIRLMSKTLKQDICGLDTPGILVTDNSQVELHLPLEVQYACLYWVLHLQKSGTHIYDGDQIDQFLQAHLLHWLEALSWMKKFSEGIVMIISLESIASPRDCPQFYDFIQDIKRFARYSRPIVEKAPLQIYLSALAFAPAKSRVRNKFQDWALRWMERLPNTGEDWYALLQTLEGHTAQVSMIISPDGTLVSVSEDCRVQLWDLTTGQSLQTLEGHSAQVNAITFSPDGKILASASDDRTIQLWDPSTGHSLQTLEGHNARVNAITFSPDGKMLASVSGDWTVKLWDLTTRESLQTLEGHNAQVNAITFSPNGKILVSASEDYTVKLWDPTTSLREPLQTLKGHSDQVNAITFSPDGKILVSASDDRTVRLWDPITGQSLQTLKGHIGWVSAITFSPDGKMLASASYDRTVRLWDFTTGQTLQILRGHNAQVKAIAFSPDGKMLASTSGSSILSLLAAKVQLWDPITGQSLQTLKGHSGQINAIAFSPDGKTLVSVSDDHTVRLWDPTTRQSLQTLESHRRQVKVITFSPDGKMLASASGSSVLSLAAQVQLWDPTTGQSLQTLKGHNDQINAIAFSPDGKKLVTASDDHTVRLWDPTTGQSLQTLEGHSRQVNAIAFSLDGKILASASHDYTVRLWDPSTGHPLQTLEGHSASVKMIAFSPDENILASGSKDYTVRLWDLTTGQSLHTFKGHNNWVNAITFSPDRKTLASASDDCRVQVWDLTTGQSLQILKDHNARVSAIAFSPDGKTLASASYDRTVRLWDLMTGQCLQILEDIPAVISLSFSKDGRYLNTDRGILIINSGALGACHHLQQPVHAFFVKDEWVTQHDQNLLWLPPEYSATKCTAFHETNICTAVHDHDIHTSDQLIICTAVHDNKLVLGYSSGQVIVLEFVSS